MSIDKDNMPDFLVRRRESFRASHGFATWGGSFEEWRASGLALLRDALGPAGHGKAAVELIAGEDDGAVQRRRLRARFPTGATAEALMLAPAKAGPHPAVLLLHDHGHGLPPFGGPVQIQCMVGFAAMVEVVGVSGQNTAAGAGGS